MYSSTFKDFFNNYEDEFLDNLKIFLMEDYDVTLADNPPEWVDEKTIKFLSSTAITESRDVKYRNFFWLQSNEYQTLTIKITPDGIYVTAPKFILLHKPYVAKIFVNRSIGLGINGVKGAYYDIEVDSSNNLMTEVVTQKFIKVSENDILDGTMNQEADHEAILINTASITDCQIMTYMEYINNKPKEKK